MVSGTFTGVVRDDRGNDASRQGPGRGALLSTNQEFIESLRSPLDPNNVTAVFRWVFTQLPRTATVYPTENYYYFSFFAGGRSYWGNIRLGVEERERGILNFVYWQYHDEPKSRHDSAVWSRAFTARDGVVIRRLGRLRYSVSYRRRRVVFRLNPLSQRRPHSLRIQKGETYLGRSCDESGFHFFLIYARKHRHFMWVLDERGYAPVLEPVSRELLVDTLSGFAFFPHHRMKRKILVGVAAKNVRRNNYWDGPFDQLPDNFVSPKLIPAIEEAYPHTKGRMDRYGKFTDQPGYRVAITPYLEYHSLEEMKEWIAKCHNQPRDEFCACITYDSKKARGN